jgi:hypothetical protein
MTRQNFKSVIGCFNGLAAFTLPYMALAYGLKLDGLVTIPWTVILSPVWLPLALFVLLLAMAMLLLLIRNMIEMALKAARRL